MPKVTVVQVVYNNRQWIEPVFAAIFNQTFKDFEFVAVIAGNDDGSKAYIAAKYPAVKIIDPGFNLGFAAGHNWVFAQSSSDFFQLVNPDLILEPNYIEEMLKTFEDEKVGAATGKLYKVSSSKYQAASVKPKIIDTTGVTINKSGRARDRGQHEVNRGQFDSSVIVDAVSGAGAMYRRTALEAVKLPKLKKNLLPELVEGTNFNPSISLRDQNLQSEYFDEDFHSYWEDVDLSWRMSNKGWKNVFVPSAIGYHGRGAGSSKKGYVDVIGFIKHHHALNPRVRQLNYKNHIFMYIKNSPWFYPQFLFRELMMFIYLLIFEPATLKVLPEIIRLLPKIWKKRRLIYR